ncbi:hypothetical protein FACS1894120_6430 [Clostridia bacterium]|nr:hypothetical protein FACS1894120_6430 [Clostridia bacterium]
MYSAGEGEVIYPQEIRTEKLKKEAVKWIKYQVTDEKKEAEKWENQALFGMIVDAQSKPENGFEDVSFSDYGDVVKVGNKSYSVIRSTYVEPDYLLKSPSNLLSQLKSNNVAFVYKKDKVIYKTPITESDAYLATQNRNFEPIEEVGKIITIEYFIYGENGTKNNRLIIIDTQGKEIVKTVSDTWMWFGQYAYVSPKEIVSSRTGAKYVLKLTDSAFKLIPGRATTGGTIIVTKNGKYGLMLVK